MKLALDIPTARWALPLLEPARYKGAKGGRSSGKSHQFAGDIVERMVCDPHLRAVCIREIQKSLTFSAKALIEAKIREFGVEDLFQVMATEIRRKNGTGICIFQGMQDHTADSIKSLEGFKIAWVEEAQSLSQRSLDLLLPTIREEGSEIWFSWNPDQPEDPVEKLLVKDPPTDATVVHVNYLENPFCPEASLREAKEWQRRDPETYPHVWLGEYNVLSDAIVLHGKTRVKEVFDINPKWDGPYYGADFGFAQDPTALVECWIGAFPGYGPQCLMLHRESYKVELGIDYTARQWADDVPGFAAYVVRADSADPGTIDYLRRHGVPRIEGVKKWQGSVEDGVRFLRQFDAIVIHERCEHAEQESRLYRYKVNKAGDVLPQIEDRHNHIWDGVRYALAPLIEPGFEFFMVTA